MNVTFSCSRCEKTSRCEVGDGFVDESNEIVCSHCLEAVKIPAGAITGGHVARCLVCPSDELFVRKDFSQRWGVSIILFGFLLSSIALAMRYHMVTFAILGVTAIIDAVLYWYTGNVLTCYRCHSEYRDVDQMDAHPRFDLEVHERYRQQAARQQQAEQDQAQQDKAQQDKAQQDKAQQDQAQQDQAQQDKAQQDQAQQDQAQQDQAQQDKALQDQAQQVRAVPEQSLQGQTGLDGAQPPAE